MKEIKVMCEPNYWSRYRKKLIAMKLDIGDWEQQPINEINGFGESLKRLLPTATTKRFRSCICYFKPLTFSQVQS